MAHNKEEDIYLRQDMVEFAADVSQSNFNVKQFKKLHAAKPIKLSNQRTRTRIYTEHQQAAGMEASMHSKTVGQGLNKTLRYNDALSATRHTGKFFGKRMNDRNPAMVKSADRLQHIKSKEKLPKMESTGSNLEKYEKQWSKGRMKERCIEEWLNSILIQYCHDEYFDKNIANSALKKLGIDQNSLVAKGLPPGNVSRLYRGLFVFGMGFNSLIGELTNGNMQVLKTIWRIYSIILEYCSKGGMVTVIGQIERDTSTKIAALTSQIVRRQEIIQRNEELNEEKNGEIFRQIKKLREDNANLNNEKTVLVEEYNSTEQAFSEEVSLRLKFQTKINEIYGLHRELGIKHQRLYSEFSTKVQQLRICADKYFQSTIKTQQFRQTQYRLREQLILLKMSCKKDKEYLDELLKQRITLITKISKLEFNSIQSQNQLLQLKNKEKLWLNDKINMESMIQFREKSSKETHSEYQITLEENNRLYILLSDQRKLMEQYEKEKKNFNSKVISIVSENSYHKRKMEENQRKLEAMQEICKGLEDKMERLNLEIQIKTKSEESYQNFFSSSEVNLVEMRRINFANEEELSFLRKYYKNMEKVLKDKNCIYEALTMKYQAAVDGFERVKVQLLDLTSKYDIISEQKRINEEIFGMKEVKLKVLQEELASKEEQLQKIRLNFILDEQKLRGKLDQVAICYKNEKFERTTLNSSYNQTLRIIEQKNKTEKEQSVKISLLEGEIEKEKTKYNVLEKNMIKIIESFGKMQEKLEETLNKQREIIVQRQQFIPPMLFEDIVSELQREQQRNLEKKQKIYRLHNQMQKQRKVSKQELDKTHQGYKHDISLLSKQLQKRIEHLTSQLSFQKHENTQLKKRVKDYEELADSYKKKINQRQTSPKEEIYKHAIEQKKKEMEKMFVEMEKLQDQLQNCKKSKYQRGNAEEIGEDWESSDRLKAIDLIKKELQHEFSLKLRELQRQMKREYSKKEQAFKEEHQSLIKGMTLQQIFKIKSIKATDAFKELSFTQKSQRKSEKLRELEANNSVDINRESFQKEIRQDSRKKRQISKLIKNAYDYYN